MGFFVALYLEVLLHKLYLGCCSDFVNAFPIGLSLLRKSTDPIHPRYCPDCRTQKLRHKYFLQDDPKKASGISLSLTQLFQKAPTFCSHIPLYPLTATQCHKDMSFFDSFIKSLYSAPLFAWRLCDVGDQSGAATVSIRGCTP